MRLFIGIDPGKSGAWAVIDQNGVVTLTKNFTDSSYKDFQQEIYVMHQDFDIAVVAIEQVHAMPGQGVSSMFSFGANYGGWLATLELLNLKHVLVRPQAWQKAILGTVPKGQSKPRALAYAQRIFPEQNLKKSHHGKVDALLIALWAKKEAI